MLVSTTYSNTVGQFFFFFNHPAPTEIYTLSLHDALPIFGVLLELPERGGLTLDDPGGVPEDVVFLRLVAQELLEEIHHLGDRKSTRLNSSHGYISYAVFCLKKKKKQI